MQFLPYRCKINLNKFRISLYNLSVRFYNISKNTNDDHSFCFIFTFFTCKKDFLNLKYALLSLKKIRLKEIKKIFVFIDKKSRLTKSQIAELESIFYNKITFSYTIYRNIKGPKRILSQLYAFRQVLKEMNLNSYIVKCDSDIVFLSKNIFQEVKGTDSDLIGQPTYHLFKHTQGGCYFLSYHIIQKILSNNVSIIFKTTCKLKKDRPLNKCPEDAFFYTFASKLQGTIKFVKFYAESKYLQNNLGAKLIGIKKNNSKDNVIHFQARLKKFQSRLWQQIEI